MDVQKLVAIKSQIEGILGNSSDPEYFERYAAMMVVLGHHVRLIALKPNEVWHKEQSQAAIDFLISVPATQARSRAIISRYLANSAVSGVPKQEAAGPQRQELAGYGENLVNWSLYEDHPLEEGLGFAGSCTHLDAMARWRVLQALIFMGLWRLKLLVPHLFADPKFGDARYDMWDAIYHMYADFAQLYPKISHLEEPIVEHKDWPIGKGAPGGGTGRIKVGVWSHKIGNYLSSMTTVHPWLMQLPDDDLDVYVLAEQKRIGDPVQDKYREIYGSRFIDCEGLSDDAFARMVTGHDFDVLMPLHKARLALEPYRLARCHFDVMGWMSVNGVPDRALINEATADPGFLAVSNRKFITVPGSMMVYSRLPDVPFAERKPNTPFCFGSFNRSAKFTEGTFDAWAQILRECPNSIFYSAAFGSTDMTRFVLCTELAKRGVDSARIVVETGNVPSTEHLARHNRVDLFLDIFPVGAGVTAIDSFHMGVPVVSMKGDKRLAPLQVGSFFATLGEEAGLNATSLEAYVDYAKKHYAQGPRSVAAREKLRSIARDSILFDADRYTRLMRKAIKLAATPTDQQVVRAEL